jgi:hypothetical protein
LSAAAVRGCRKHWVRGAASDPIWVLLIGLLIWAGDSVVLLR